MMTTGTPVRRAIFFGICGALLASCSGTGGDKEGEEAPGSVEQAVTTLSLSLTVPTGKRASEVAASAAGTLKLSDRATLRIDGSSGYPLATSLGPATLDVGSDSKTGPIIAKGSIFLRERARVDGYLTTAGTKTAQNGTVVTGAVTQFADVQPHTWSRQIDFPDATSGDVKLEPDQTRVILPGAYTDLLLKPRAKLYLSSGTYYLRSFKTEPDSKIYLDQTKGGIYVYVQQGDSFVRNTWIQNGGAAGDLLLGYLGTTTLSVEKPFVGTIIAPNAKLDMREVGSAGHIGSFYAKDLEVFSQATLWKSTMPSGIWGDADPCSFGLITGDACKTSAACPVGGSKTCDVQETCGCVAPPGKDLPCLIEQATDAGESRYVPAPDGSACVGPSGAGACNVDGYCVVKNDTADDDSSCTDDQPAGGDQYTHTPLENGTACFEEACGSEASTCEAGVCGCVRAIANDGNECTIDSCSGPTCTNTPDPTLLGKKCHDGDCIGICQDSGACLCASVAPAPAGAPLRVLTANVAALPNMAGIAPTLGFGSCHTNWLGDADYECLAQRLAEKVLASNYDVVVFNEAFDDSYQDAAFDALHGSAADGRFPYVIRKLDASGWAGGWNAYNDSGLMLFSKFPFDTLRGGESDCLDVDYNIDVEGAEYEEIPISTGRGGTGVYRRNKSAVGFRPFDGGAAEEGEDALVNKGVGFARIVAPTGFKYDIFFSHAQASYGSDSAETWRNDRVGARRLQFEIAANLISCLQAVGGAQATVFAGDLNVNGDVSNPYSDPDDATQIGGNCSFFPSTTCPALQSAGQLSPTDECVTFPKGGGAQVCLNEKRLREQRNNNRAEWDYFFNTALGGVPFFKTELLDSWANAMQEHSCLPAFAGLVPDNCRPVLADNANPLMEGLRGLVDYDRGFTWGNQESEERLDYILFGSDNKSASQRFGDFGPQHITKAYNIWEGYAFEGGITQHPPAGEPTPQLGGEQLLSDHIGLNGEIDFATPHSTPQDAYVVTFPQSGEIEMRLERRGSVQWFRINEPGSYTFSVNPANHIPPRASNGITYRVYTADELSKPRMPYKGELLTQQPYRDCYAGTGEFRDCYVVPGFTEAKFKATKAPLFIKVFHESSDYAADYTGRYLFLYKRTRCTSLGEACDLAPYFIHDFRMTWEIGEGWFAFQVDKPDAASQNLELVVTEGEGATAESILSVGVMDQDGNPIMYNDAAVQLTRGSDGKWSLPGAATILEPRSDPFFGSKFFLKVTRNPTWTAAFKLTLETKTNLTWLYGPELGGAPGAIHCNNSQEVGDDEIWMAGLPNGSTASFPGNGNQTTELNGAFDEDENDEWTVKLLNGYRQATPRRPRAALFTETFKVRLWEDDHESDETADRTFSALGPVLGSRLAPSGWWNFPKAFLVNTGDNYEGRGPTLSHQLDARVCQTNDDCQAPLICGGSLCTRP